LQAKLVLIKLLKLLKMYIHFYS